MVDTFNVYEAKSQLSALIDRVSNGERIVIARAGKPMALLSPFPKKKHKRVPGRLKGKLWIAPDAFSSEVDARIAADFCAAPLFPPRKKPRKP